MFSRIVVINEQDPNNDEDYNDKVEKIKEACSKKIKMISKIIMMKKYHKKHILKK